MYNLPLPPRNEAHLVNAPNGHRLSTDCWCEPTCIYWRTNVHGIPVLIVEHNDEEDITVHHAGIIYTRDRAQDWVTRELSAVNPFPEKETP